MTVFNEENRIYRPSAKDEKWRLTCDNIGKQDVEKSIDAGIKVVDTDNERLLEILGFTKSSNESLTLKAFDNTVESEIVKGKRVVHRRISKDGNVLDSNKDSNNIEVR